MNQYFAQSPKYKISMESLNIFVSCISRYISNHEYWLNIIFLFFFLVKKWGKNIIKYNISVILKWQCDKK